MFLPGPAEAVNQPSHDRINPAIKYYRYRLRSILSG
jgi:hypothetical protein